MPVIVLVIKTCFFTDTNSYGLGHKPYTSYFFHLFCGKMIKVVCAMFAIAIEILGVQLSNLNLSMGKSAIQFESLVQKGKTGEQMDNIIYFFYLFTNNLIEFYARIRET